MEGHGEALIGGVPCPLLPNSSPYLVALSQEHRISNTHDSDLLVILEIQRGDLLSEADITRLEDDYGRTDCSL